jgi:hypothetical protein
MITGTLETNFAVLIRKEEIGLQISYFNSLSSGSKGSK